MNDEGRSRIETLLDLLTEEVADRLQARAERQPAPPEPPPERESLEEEEARENGSIGEGEQAPVTPPPPDMPIPQLPEELPLTPAHAASSAVLMARLAIGILIIVVLINIPYNAQGMALARSIPSSASLIIADGLLVKESNSPDIYVYRNDAFHWVTSLDVFEAKGYHWENVHIVEPGYLDPVIKGAPLYQIFKCAASPHIYRLENGHKRWIMDIDTFTAEGHLWDDVEFVGCGYLRSLPDGDSIPPGHGTPTTELP
jgi:hypothetical protein